MKNKFGDSKLTQWIVVKRLDGIYEPIRIPMGQLPEKIKYPSCDKLLPIKAKFSHLGCRELPFYSEFKVYPAKLSTD